MHVNFKDIMIREIHQLGKNKNCLASLTGVKFIDTEKIESLFSEDRG